MALSIPRLRAVLIAGAALLVVVVTAYIGLGRYRSLQLYRRLIKRSGVSLTHDTNGFTYSQSLQGRTVFTLHAAKATQLGSGNWALHDAELTLYDRLGHAADHVKSAEIDYDEKAQVARALGVVDMDLLPPQGLANGGHAAIPDAEKTDAAKRAEALAAAEVKAAPAQPIHVRASGLVYQRKLGIASTDQRVDFTYGGMQCTAVGAEFNSDESRLRLLSQVRMEGVAHGKPLHVTAERADMDRDSNVATLTRPTVTSEDQSASADNAILNLRKDGSIERLQAGEHVVMRSLTQEITAARLDATLNAQTLPEKARLSGGVAMSGTNTLRPMHGSAATVDALFNAQGLPTVVTGDGGARLSMADMRASARGLMRSMEGQRIVATFVAGTRRGTSRVSEVHASGAAHAAGESIAAAKAGSAPGSWLLKTTQVAGDDLRLEFSADAQGKAQADKLYATGHPVLRQDGPQDAQETSSGDTLEVSFGPTKTAGAVTTGGFGVASAVQMGHVMIHSRAASKAGSAEPGGVSTGSGERASYDGATQRLTLSGNAHLEGDSAAVSAPVVVLDQRTEDAEAQGGVQATIESARRDAASKPQPVTHVIAASARFEHAAKIAEFYGTDAQPARMWQEASQVQAAVLRFDGEKRTFSARPSAVGAQIHAVFVGAAAAPKPGTAARPASIVRVAAEKMDYNDVLREATFSGGIVMDGSTGEVRGERGVVFMTAKTKDAAATKGQQTEEAKGEPNPFGGSIDRVIVSGDVQMQQPGRKGSGDQLLYTAATGTYMLTGTPAVSPRIVDAQQGSVTGTTLMFGDAGSTIVVAGDAGAKGQSGRVRSELSVRPKKDERQ